MTDIVGRLNNPSADVDIGLLDDAADEIESLRQQLAECQAERDGKQVAYDEIYPIAADRTQKLYECQARERSKNEVLMLVQSSICLAADLSPESTIGKLYAIVSAVVEAPPDSTVLDTLKKQWQREALLEAAEQMESYCGPTVYYELHRMANKLEETK